MPSLNDTIYNKLGTLDFAGSLNDRLSSYYADYLGISQLGKSLSHLERQFLFDKLGGATVGSNQDLWYEFLIGEGYTGSNVDMMKNWWDSLTSDPYASVGLVRHHVAADVTFEDSGNTFVLPNRATAYGLPAYSQTSLSAHPTQGSSNGIEWVATPKDGTDRWLQTPSNADVVGTDIIAVVRRLDNNTTAFFTGEDLQNMRVGFFSNKLRFTNFYSVETGTVVITGATHGWIVLHGRFLDNTSGSFLRAYDRDGVVIDQISSTSLQTSQVQDLLLGSHSGSSYDSSDLMMSRVLVYSHDLEGVPSSATDEVRLAAARAEASTLQGS